ncbi:MAG: hypothetical protein RIQ47_1731 [Bacteroidota bacterium]|jgi:glycosyltransferase involved in cell wall biosynthesis
MRVAIIGSRGIPARYGGFETLAEQLAVALPSNALQLTVVGEGAVMGNLFPQVKIVQTFFTKRKNPLLYYFESLLRVLSTNEVILILGAGAGPFIWLPRLLGRRIITNVDGLEHLRQKYSLVQRFYVRIAQRCTAWFSNQIIADSEIVADFWREQYRVPSNRMTVIRYGAARVDSELMNNTDKVLRQFAVEKANYYLTIARIVPENNIKMIIDGFIQSGSRRALLIIGNWSDSVYGSDLKKMNAANILLVDAVYDLETTTILRQYCLAYLHGHSVGGTNPTLVEALANGALTVCHDNLFNRETVNNSGFFFSDAAVLAASITTIENSDEVQKVAMKLEAQQLADKNYSWTAIVSSYDSILRAV